MAVRIMTDSTADLPPALIKELEITVVPVYVNLHGRSYREGVDISLDDIYREMVDNDATVTTSQPAPADFAEAYRQLMKDADEILSINISTHLSSTCSSAIKAQELVDGQGRIEVIDSASVSMGTGLITIAAARLAQAGASLPHILDETKRAISHTHIWGLLDTLKYVLRSGRIGKAKALLGSLLAIKPMITVKDGEINPAGMARTRQKGLDKLVANLESFADIDEVGIAHSTTPDEAQTLRQRLSTVLDIRRIHLSRLGPAVGTHTGPGTLVLTLREKLPAVENAIVNTSKKLVELPSRHLPHMSIRPLAR
ncbi:MAG: DegV family protein [Dehalococcoidia bacterium]|nr:DegV family protein [Dehalococcoidia bacterium]